jgi:hypothetical protein
MSVLHKNGYYGKIRKTVYNRHSKNVSVDIFRCFHVFVELAFVSLLMGYHYRSRVLT